jgi:predicted metal-dependent phosphotriesterase family hydrolase
LAQEVLAAAAVNNTSQRFAPQHDIPIEHGSMPQRLRGAAMYDPIRVLICHVDPLKNPLAARAGMSNGGI